jgi:Ser/Thr protein kinase RdoA (MazF antagonist)
VLQGLGEGAEHFGLIHADLHQTNTLFHNGRAGRSTSTTAASVTGSTTWRDAVLLRDHPDFDRLREAFLAGYRRSHPLYMEEEVYLGTFMALRTIQDMLWDVEERDLPAFRDRWHAQMTHQLQALRGFVKA